MTPTAAGSIQATTTEPGWIRIPERMPPAERDAWVEEALGALRDAWGESWDDVAESRATLMLEGSLDDRPDAHMVFEAWPIFRPVRARIQISMIDPATLPDWRAAGFGIVGYDDAGIGPGIMCVRMRDTADANPVTLVDWCAVFADGRTAVIVLVETLPLDLLVRILPGLHGLIGTLAITLPGGAPFRAAPSEHAITDDEVWTELRLRSAGIRPDAAAADGSLDDREAR
ncbi:MAG: hypothetical protein ACQEWM_02895 [Actinomycetota bacterium]